MIEDVARHTRDCREARRCEGWSDRADSGSGGRCVCCGAPLTGPVRRVWGLGWVTAACGCGPEGMDPPPERASTVDVDADAIDRAQRDAERQAWLDHLDDQADLRAERAEEARRLKAEERR